MSDVPSLAMNFAVMSLMVEAIAQNNMKHRHWLDSSDLLTYNHDMLGSCH